MSNNAFAKNNDLLLTIYRLAQERPVECFRDEALNAVKHHLATHASMWDAATTGANGEAVHRPPEVELLARLAPHLMQALAINRLVHLNRLVNQQARSKWSVAITDLDGVFYHADPRFKELVFKAWRACDQQRLPDELLRRLCAAGHDAADADKGQRIEAGGIIIQRGADQGLMFLKARASEPVDTLTEREFLVARLIAGGMTHKQVAVKLERSPDTVRTQLKAVFNKLGINNVALLGALLTIRE